MKLVLSLFYIGVAVNGDCDNGTTKRLVKKQLKALEKSVNMVVADSSCCKPKLTTPVAFHAEIGSDINRVYTYKGGSVWIFDNVVTNVGNAYNPATGKFTTPRKGVYQFNWYSLSNPGTASHAGLYVNGKIKGRQVSNNSGGGNKYLTAGSSIVLALKKGDSVYIMDAWGHTATVRGSWTAFGGVQLS